MKIYFNLQLHLKICVHLHGYFTSSICLRNITKYLKIDSPLQVCPIDKIGGDDVVEESLLVVLLSDRGAIEVVRQEQK